MRRSNTLKTGCLDLEVHRADFPLETLCGFASRNNPLRGYLFVSKVLGKHYPVRPSAMQNVYLTLAKKLAALELKPPVVAIALAETATGFGQGVFEALMSQEGFKQRLFIHTTRYRLRHQEAFQFEEQHCHAAEHILYQPVEAEGRDTFLGTRTLLLLDDEMSTGNTLANLARAFGQINTRLERIVIVTITNWLNDRTREALASRMPCQLEFVSLLDGEFSFTPNESHHFVPVCRSVGNGEPKDDILGYNYGRLGLKDAPKVDVQNIAKGLDLSREGVNLILGTGEFSYVPYTLALALEEDGYEVYFQSSTRSPILLNGDITHKIGFEDNYHDGIDNFLYNARPGQYDRVVACYETRPLPEGHSLPRQLGAQVVFF